MIDRVCSLLKMQKPEMNRGYLFASGATVPSDGTDGYQTGCIFQHTDGGAGTALYLNEGSITSCDFNRIESPGGSLTIADLQDVADAFSTRLLETGTYSSSASKGVTLSSTNTRPFSLLYDDAGVALSNAGVVRGMLSRVLLTVDVAGSTILPARGQLKMLDGVDVETGIYAPVQGYIEMAGTHISKSGATLSCLSASMEITTKLTVNSGGEAAGLHVETTGAGTITNNGTCAGILIDHASGAADWPVGLLITGTDVLIGVQVGSQANTAGSGLVLDATSRTGSVRSFCDDGGVNIADSVRNIQARTLLTTDASGSTVRSLQGQLKLTDGTDVETGVYTGVQGYVELMGDHSSKSGAKFSCFDASVEIASTKTLTIDSGGEFAGVHIETTGSGSITNNGTCAGILISNPSGAPDWPVGLQMVGTDVLVAVQIGAQSNTAGSGVVLDATTRTGAVKVYTDDAGSSVADSVRGILSRTLLTVDQTGGTIRASQGQLKMLDLVDLTSGVYCGLQGYVEMAGTHIAKTGSKFSCVDASMEIGTALTIDSGGLACGIHVETTGSGTITNNGTCAGIVVDKGGSADWPFGLILNDCARLMTGAAALSGSTAWNAIEITTTSTQTHSSGYQRSIYCNHTHQTNAATGSSEINVIAADLQCTANVGQAAYCFTAYTGSMAGATINRVAHYAGYLDAITGTVNASSVAFFETNGGATYNSFIALRRHAGTIHAIISDKSGGITATNLFEFEVAGGPATLAAGTYSTAEGYMTIKVAGSTYRMPFYSGTD